MAVPEGRWRRPSGTDGRPSTRAGRCEAVVKRGPVRSPPDLEQLRGPMSPQRKPGSERMTQERVLVGIDVAKARLDVHLRPCGEVFALGNHKAGWRALAQRLRKLDSVAVGIEASGGYEKGLARHLVKTGIVVYVFDPAQLRAFARGLRRHAKTDPIDAAMIARCLEATIEDAIPYQPDPLAERLAALVAYRTKLVAESAALKGYRDTLQEPLVRRMVDGRRASLKLALARLDQAIAGLIAGTPGFARRFCLLVSVPGVGPVLASTLIALLPELGRIGAKAVAALVGVAPFNRQSGRTDRRGRCRGGRGAVRTVLYMATLSAIRCRNPAIAPFYDRLRRAGKPAKPAIVAAMRKLITILNAIARDQQPCTAHA
jgi:transposase